MPLDKQKVSVVFSQGVDTKSDPKQVMAKMLRLENGIFVTANMFRKRNGYRALGSGIEGATPVPVGEPSLSALVANASFKEELLGFTGTDVYSYAPATTKWSNKGEAVSTDLSVFPAVRNAYSQSAADSTYHPSGFIASIWEDSRGGVRYSVMDSETHQYFQQDVSLDSSGTRPKVLPIGNYIVFFYALAGTNKIRYAALSVLNPSVALSASDFATNLNGTDVFYDALVIGQRIFVSWNTTTGGGAISTKYINSVLTISSARTISSQAATQSLGIVGDETLQQVWVCFHDGTDLSYFVLDYDLSLTVLATTTIEVLANAQNVTGYVDNGSGTIYYQVTGSPTYNTLIRSNTATNAGVVGTAGVFLRSVGLFSKTFRYNSVTYMVTAYASDVQPTYFIVNSSARVITKVAMGNGGGLTARAMLPGVIATDSDSLLFCYLEKDLLTSESGIIYNQTGVMQGLINFTSENTFLRTELANNLHFTGGILSMYDGVSVVEHGYNVYPETLSNTPSSPTGAIKAGTRQYVGVYEWVDNYGQIHRSAPSIPLTVVNTAGTAVNFTGDTTNGSTTVTNLSATTNLIVGQVITGAGIPAGAYITSIGVSTLVLSAAATATAAGVALSTVETNKNTISFPTLRLTQKKSPRAPVSLVIYRTEASGTVFYRVTSVSSPTLNSTTSDAVTYADTVSDVYLVANEILYTTGGEVENIEVPAASLVTTFDNRVIVVPSEDRLSYWYSKQVGPQIPVQFSDFFIERVDATGGDVTGIAKLDDKLILFKKNCSFFVTGAGPTPAGTQNTLSPPQLVTSDSGCINPRSIVSMPLGLMYQSSKGIYLLDRSLKDQYIGDEVEAYNNLTITSAQLIPDTNQVRFTTAEGTCLMYDYFFDQWSVFTNHLASDSCIFQNLFTYANPTGVMYQETPSEYTDAGYFIPLSLYTGWLSFAQLQGFQRVYKAMILGQYKSPHRLLVRTAYDFNDEATQENYIDAEELLETPVYGGDEFYGDTTPYGGDYPLYQFRVFMTRQKCEAIQFQIQDVQTTDFGEGMTLSAIGLEVGAKRGLNKLPAARSFGQSA